MNIAEKKIFDSYAKNVWNNEVESAFYDVWNQPNHEFLQFTISIIKSNKNNNFTQEAIRLVGFYKDLITDSDRTAIKELLDYVITSTKSNYWTEVG